MKKLLIAPFHKDMCPLLRHRDMMHGYELATAIPAKGFGWEGKDVCELDGGLPTGFVLGGSWEDGIAQCDAVLLGDSAENDTLRESTPKESIMLPSAATLKWDVSIQPNQPLKKLPIPVVMVMGLGPNCQKFDLQIGLRRAFTKEGYKVSQFGTKAYSHLFGFETLPDAPELPLWQKIYMYNRLFREMYEREKPDVMLIGVPGGMMPLNSYTPELFGETALALTTAARPDISLLSFYYTQPLQKFFEYMRNYMQFRLGVKNIIFHASNTKLIEELSLRRIDYLTLESSFVLENQVKIDEGSSLPLFNALIPESYEPAYRHIIDTLRRNVCVM